MIMCNCSKSTATYWPTNGHRAESKENLLGTPEQFCSSFFHVLPCRELDIPEHVCLQADSRACHHQCITIVARLQGVSNLVVRYTNCMQATAPPIHAEEFLIADDTLLVPGATLTLYMQLQPCHYSGNSDRDPPDHRSCTTALIKWYTACLAPRGITLNIRCSNLYKAMWEYSPAQLRKLPPNWRHSRAAHSARIGLQLMADAGLAVQHIDNEGWAFLLSLVHAAKIEPTQQAAREHADAAVCKFLERFHAPLLRTDARDDAVDDLPER